MRLFWKGSFDVKILATIFAILIFVEPRVALAAADKAVSLDELQRHNSESDCWMAVDGLVYDMSPYIKLHLEKCRETKFTAHCGTDASLVWSQKESGKLPHKKKSHRGLQKSKIGTFSSK